MLSLYQKAVATLIALTFHNIVALDLRELDRKSTIQKSDVAEYEKMLKVDSDDKLFLYWNVDDDLLDVRVVYKGLAWLGFGISTDGKVDDAEAIIGKPEKPKRNQVRKYSFIGDQWTKTEKMYQKFQTLEARSLVQDESSTSLSFKKLLTEDGEIAVNGKGKNYFFLVVGEKNEFAEPKQKYSLKINLNGNHGDLPESDSDKEESTKKEIPATDESQATDNRGDLPVSKNDGNAQGSNATKREKYVSKKGNYMYVIVAAFIGGLSLLTLMVGTVAMMREAERDHTGETMYEPFMHDLR